MSSNDIVKKATKLKDKLKQQVGMPILIAAFIIALSFIIQNRKCVANKDDISRYEDDTLVKIFKWGSWVIVFVVIFMLLLEYTDIFE